MSAPAHRSHTTCTHSATTKLLRQALSKRTGHDKANAFS